MNSLSSREKKSREEKRIKDTIGELGLVIKRSDTFDSCLLCRFDGIHPFCLPGLFETLRIRKSDYYILICRLKLINYLERTLRRGFLAKLILILMEVVQRRQKAP